MYRDIAADVCDMSHPGLERILTGMKHSANLSGNLLFFKRVLNWIAVCDLTFCGKLSVPAETMAHIRVAYRPETGQIAKDTGLDLISRMPAIKGHPSPDLDRLEAHMVRIIEVTGACNFALNKYLARMGGFLPLMTAAKTVVQR